MAVPLLPLNLAPRPSLWRQQHPLLGWAALDSETAFVMPAEEYTLAQAVASSEMGLVFAVADGLGGYGGGLTAARRYG